MSVSHRAKFRDKRPAATCAKCKKAVTDKVTCNLCASTYHRSCARLFVRFKPDIVCCVRTLGYLLGSVPSPSADTPLAPPHRAPACSTAVSPRADTQVALQHRASVDITAGSSLASPRAAKTDPTAVPPLASPCPARIASLPAPAEFLPVTPLLTLPCNAPVMFPFPNYEQAAGAPSSSAQAGLPSDWASLDTKQQLDRVVQTCMAAATTAQAAANTAKANAEALNALTAVVQQNATMIARNRNDIQDMKYQQTYGQPLPEIIITGIPAATTITHPVIIQRILARLDLPQFENDILSIRKVNRRILPTAPLAAPATQAPAYETFSLIVKFKSIDVRNHVSDAKRKVGMITVSEILHDCATVTCRGKIFISEFLPSSKYSLYSKTRVRAQQNNYSRVWHKNGSIYVRKTETSPILYIVTEQDLDQLI